jgi:hypothetical protein
MTGTQAYFEIALIDWDNRNYAGHAFVLPTTHRPMHAPRAGRALLGASAAEIDNFLNNSW